MNVKAIASKLPGWIKVPLWRMRAISYYGNGRFCPVCEKSSSRFRTVGGIPRRDAQCVHCRALERHRLLWLFLKKKTDLFDGNAKQVLHVAPEVCFESRFRKCLGESYITADLISSSVMVNMDITDIDYPDESFDVIFCSHVLEHVQDDRKAMTEFYRTLKDTGWAILLVPITAESTFEDPSITEPAERQRLFGQHNHVRRYGRDYADRLRDAGFCVEVTRVSDLAENDEATRMGLTPACGEIYFCKKPSL